MEQLCQSSSTGIRERGVFTEGRTRRDLSERLHVESAMYATDLVRTGAVGRVLQVIGLGPHRLNASARPPWFFAERTTVASSAT